MYWSAVRINLFIKVGWRKLNLKTFWNISGILYRFLRKDFLSNVYENIGVFIKYLQISSTSSYKATDLFITVLR